MKKDNESVDLKLKSHSESMKQKPCPGELKSIVYFIPIVVSPKSPVNTQFSSLQLHFFPLSLLRLLSIVKSGEIASFTKRWFASRVVMSVSFSKSASTISPKKLNFQNIKAFALPNIIYITGPHSNTRIPDSEP